MKGYRKLPFTTTWLVFLVYVLLAAGYVYLDSLKMLQLLMGMAILYALSFHRKQSSTLTTYAVLLLFVLVIEWEIDGYLAALPSWLAIGLTWFIAPWLIDIGFGYWQQWQAKRAAQKFLTHPPANITIRYYFDHFLCLLLASVCALCWVPMLYKLLIYATVADETWPWSTVFLFFMGLPIWNAYINQIKLDLFLNEQGREHIHIDEQGLSWKHLVGEPKYLMSEQLAWQHIGDILLEKNEYSLKFDTVVVRAKSNLPDDVHFTQIRITQPGPFVSPDNLYHYLCSQRQLKQQSSGL